MPLRRGLLYALLASGVLAVAGLTGCSQPRPQDPPGELRLRRIAQAYHLAAGQFRRPPRNADELGRFFKELGETDPPDQLLRSPRDGEPYVILFGEDFDPEARDTVMAYERRGADGARYVLMLSREVKLMKDEEFARTTFAQGHKPTPGK